MRNRTRRWTDEEYGFLMDNESMTAREAGEHLGRGMQSVQHARNKLRDGWAPQVEPWTDSEIDFVRTTPHLTSAQVAQKLGRTKSSVDNRRFALRRDEGLDFNAYGGAKSPFWVGPRKLLARTCPDCGMTLAASWFGVSRQKGRRDTWQTKCTRCRPRNDGHLLKDRGDSARKAEARLQAISLPHAHHNREPWTQEDHKVLADPDMLVIEKALSLGRTYLSVRSACSKFGYQSLVGRGDPAKGQWYINNPNAKEYAL